MRLTNIQKEIDEIDPDFYDLEYCLSMEYRYFSGAHGSRVRNILSVIGEVKGLRCLDIGCGGGYFPSEFQKRGASVIGIDYSRYVIEFGKNRFPYLDLRVQSGYDLDSFDSGSFDLVTLIDAIEHMSNHHKVLRGIHRILNSNGRLILSTDVESGPWSKPWLRALINKSLALSSEGRAYRLIKKVESHRRKLKNYHSTHIALLGYKDIVELLESERFRVTAYRIYPLVGVPARDFLFKLAPMAYRGDHQCLAAQKVE